MAALDDDNIVGTDPPAKPLSRRVLDMFVAEPHVMGLFVKAQFKLRTSNKKLDDDTVEKLCSKASHTLRISECSQHEPTLGVASAIMPLTACWCVPARRVLLVVAVSLRQSCLTILRLLQQSKQVCGGCVAARVWLHRNQAAD